LAADNLNKIVRSFILFIDKILSRGYSEILGYAVKFTAVWENIDFFDLAQE